MEQQKQIQLKQSIAKSPLLYTNMMTQIDDIISGKSTIQGIKMENLIALKNELEGLKSSKTFLDIETKTIQTQNEQNESRQDITYYH